MVDGLLGKKLGMTHVFDAKGRFVPVTLIQAGPCYVLQIKTVQSDGYNAVQLGFEAKRENRTNRPQMGRIEKINQRLMDQAHSAAVSGERSRTAVEKIAPLRFVREIRVPNPTGYEVGQRIGVDIFAVGEKVDVIGTSKGRGFAGTIKRFHTKRGPETHGSNYHRRPGSMGASSYPSRTFKGKVLPGHMGNHRTTAANLTVVEADVVNNVLAVKGSVPGHVNAFVIIRKNSLSRKG